MWGAMRKHVGWQETIDGVKWEIRVLFQGKGRLEWRRVNRGMERWEKFEPDAEQWSTLLEKVKARYVRRQTPWEEVVRVEREAARVRGAGGTE